MKFFDLIGQSISDAGQGVSQQAKNLADTARLNRKIADDMQRITQLYTEIGKAYYQGHSQDPQAEMLESIEEITALNEDIFRCREYIKQIRGVTKCPNCGKDVAANAAFCSVCGAKIPESGRKENSSDATVERRCPKCGRTVAEEDLFCNYCGTRMDS